jgi:hypothetical protein
MSPSVLMGPGSQFDGTRCDSSNGSHSGLPGVCQDGLGNQLDANQDASSCCLADECQATTWNDGGSVVLSPPPTGLVDWTSLHRTELSNRVVQSMGTCFVYWVYVSIYMHTNLNFQLE